MEKDKELEDQMNEISSKINTVRTDMNEVNNSISNDKLKKVQDDIYTLEQKMSNT